MVWAPNLTLERHRIFAEIRLLLAGLLATSGCLGCFGGVRDDGVLALMHREQPLFADGTLGLAQQLRMGKSQFCKGNWRAAYIGIRNGLVALVRPQYVEP
jgi:hypothetical protein